ncbi:hypothetical protein QYE76_030067 [Lolium multiflorum]|uniref:Uncharacterized protein n=1 Tax=Lolium multiflorum TaxID=4521 RepID=A0AAD8VH95_LOLMU|nr:hypothetical protein QYE76_030067 [Lolium multiflorum]
MVMFTTRRSIPELVVPAEPTPRETKFLSGIDNYINLRFYATGIQFFRLEHSHEKPGSIAKAIKAALAAALVYYYPIAGRLREVPNGELVVDCTAEGVMFVEATADVQLKHLGQPLLPPYPCVEELMFDAGRGDGVVVARPLFTIQVINLTSMIEGGGAVPSVLPVWRREILMARNPLCIRDIFPAYVPFLNGSRGNHRSSGEDLMLSRPPEAMVTEYLHFTGADIAHLQRHIPMYLGRSVSTFDLLTAVMWRCRTKALGYKPDQQVRLMFTMSVRGKWKHIPRGYYGNAFVYPIVETTVDDLCGNTLGHSLELICKAKLDMSLERMKSMVDMMSGLQHGLGSTFKVDNVYYVSDLTRLGHEEIDFPWAQWVGGSILPVQRPSSFHVKCKNGDGEESVVVSVLMQKSAIGRLAKEMAFWLNKPDYTVIPISSL